MTKSTMIILHIVTILGIALCLNRFYGGWGNLNVIFGLIIIAGYCIIDICVYGFDN